MTNSSQTFRAPLVLGLTVFSASFADAWAYVPGDFFTSDPSARAINRYNSAGSLIESLSVPSTFGNNTKGLSFGPDGRLYSVLGTSSGYNVVAIDGSGTIATVGSGATYVQGNLSFGKIGFAPSSASYVAAQNDLIAFAPGNTTGTTIFSDNQVFDMKVLPSGNLFVLTAYSIQEITSTGSLVRAVNSSILLTDARGLEYDAVTNDLYVTVLGNSGSGFFKTMRLDATTGNVEATTTFDYGDDIALMSTGNIVVGSRTMPPQIFDANLNPLGTLGSAPQMFVTQFAAPVPEPASLLVLSVGGVFMLRRRKLKENC